jgi:hypothetical protein
MFGTGGSIEEVGSPKVAHQIKTPPSPDPIMRRLGATAKSA